MTQQESATSNQIVDEVHLDEVHLTQAEYVALMIGWVICITLLHGPDTKDQIRERLTLACRLLSDVAGVPIEHGKVRENLTEVTTSIMMWLMAQKNNAAA